MSEMSEKEQQRWEELSQTLIQVRDEADPHENLVAYVTCDGGTVTETPETRIKAIKSYVRAVRNGVTETNLLEGTEAGGVLHVRLVTMIVREKTTGRIRMHIDSNRMECGCE